MLKGQLKRPDGNLVLEYDLSVEIGYGFLLSYNAKKFRSSELTLTPHFQWGRPLKALITHAIRTECQHSDN